MNVLEKYEGKPLTFTAPSGRVFTIREQNGDDDDILSAINPKNQTENIDNINRFISAIIIKDHETGNAYITLSDTSALILKDKYYILLKSRIHSNGPELKYELNCRNENCEEPLGATEDLNQYDADFSQPFGEGNGFKYQITPHASGSEKYREFSLPSGKKLRYQYMTGFSEQKVLEITKSQSTVGKNLEVIARSLEILVGSEWQLLATFSVFSAREMSEIRKDIQANDKQWSMISEVKCLKCGQVDYLPLTALSGFFYPSEV